MAQSRGGWLSPGGRGTAGGRAASGGGGGGGNNEANTVDIIQMLTKARSEYNKVWGQQ